jgi:hypothetical protein
MAVHNFFFKSHTGPFVDSTQQQKNTYVDLEGRYFRLKTPPNCRIAALNVGHYFAKQSLYRPSHSRKFFLENVHIKW